jgi:hypothetical protein
MAFCTACHPEGVVGSGLEDLPDAGRESRKGLIKFNLEVPDA